MATKRRRPTRQHLLYVFENNGPNETAITEYESPPMGRDDRGQAESDYGGDSLHRLLLSVSHPNPNCLNLRATITAKDSHRKAFSSYLPTPQLRDGGVKDEAACNAGGEADPLHRRHSARKSGSMRRTDDLDNKKGARGIAPI